MPLRISGGQAGAQIPRGHIPRRLELLANVGPAVILHELTSRRALRPDLADRIIAQIFPT